MTIAATTPGSKSRLTREQLAIRQRLQLKFLTITDEWFVYTTKHGSDSANNIFRWYVIDKETTSWYQANFPNIPVTVE